MIVADRTWERSGSEFTTLWGGNSWTLRLDDPRPGLRRTDQAVGRLLTLEGIAASGSSSPNALSGETLVLVEQFRSRIEATYAPPGWGGLKVRAAWSPCRGRDGIDLEIQVLASSIDELKDLEVFAASQLLDAEVRTEERQMTWVEPRDIRAAALSYDGREPLDKLHRLTTLPVPEAEAPVFEPLELGPVMRESGRRYFEMAHPHDVARRILEGAERNSTSTPLRAVSSVRYGLFGLYLEKGVVIRGRLRGVWVQGDDAERKALSAYRDFLDEPCPLGI